MTDPSFLTMMHRHCRPHSSFSWRSTGPDEIRDKKRNTAKRLFCFFAFDRPPIDKIRQRSRWVERLIREIGIERLIREIWRMNKNKPGQTAARFSYQAWVFWTTSGWAQFALNNAYLRQSETSSNFDRLDPVGFIPISHEGRSIDVFDKRFMMGVDHPRIRQVFARH